MWLSWDIQPQHGPMPDLCESAVGCIGLQSGVISEPLRALSPQMCLLRRFVMMYVYWHRGHNIQQVHCFGDLHDTYALQLQDSGLLQSLSYFF